MLLLSLGTSFFSSFKERIEESSRPQIGFLVLKGEIVDSATYVKHLRLFERTPSIKGILIKCNCGGGAAPASQALYQELLLCKKPIVFYVENLCASGAYYAALAAKKIIANPCSIVGSIGVVMSLAEIKGLLDRYDIHINLLHAGKYKTVGAFTQPLTNEQQTILQSVIDDTYNQFVEAVADARNLDLETREKWAEGRIFTGKQALELGLIDELGSFSLALDSIKEMTDLVDADVRLVSPKKQSPLIATLQGSDDEEGSDSHQETAAVVGSFLRSVFHYFSYGSDTSVMK